MMNDAERRLWVENDEYLYLYWKRCHMGLYRFVREHRAEIDQVIQAELNPKEHRRY